MLHCIRDTRRRSLRNPEEGKRLGRINCRYNRFEILDPARERQVADVPVSHSTATLIVTHVSEMFAEEADPVSPNRALPFVLEVSHPVCRFDQGRTRAGFGPRELNSVLSAQISNALCRLLDHAETNVLCGGPKV